MSKWDHRCQHFGARLMLETIGLKYSWPPYLIEQAWTRYLDRLQNQQLAAVDDQMKMVRFSLVSRAGRDRDWIRSRTKYGYPPIPDD